MQLNTKKEVINILYEAYKKELYSRLKADNRMKKYYFHSKVRNFIGYTTWSSILVTALSLLLGILSIDILFVKVGLFSLFIATIEHLIAFVLKSFENFNYHKDILPYQIDALNKVLNEQHMDIMEDLDFDEPESLVVQVFSKVLVVLSTISVVVAAMINSDNESIVSVTDKILEFFKDGNWNLIIGSVILILIIVYLISYFFDFTINFVKDTPYERWGEMQSVYIIKKYKNNHVSSQQQSSLSNIELTQRSSLSEVEST